MRYDIYQLGNRWAMQVADAPGFGDAVFSSHADAIAYADQTRKLDTVNAEFRAIQAAKAESARAEQAAKDAPLTAYLESLSLPAMRIGRIRATLSSQVSMRADGQLYSGRRFEVIALLVGAGYRPTVASVQKVKDVSRRRFNRMDGNEQAAHARRMAESGTRIDYRLERGDSFFSVTQAEYDFASYVLSN